MKTFHTDVSVLTENLFKLERSGRYEEALAELRPIWEDTNAFPEVDEFAPRTAAEIILRCGALIGFLGQIRQLPNSQEKSKNLITEARRRFLDIYDVEKIIECENYLSLAYTRTGEYVEAEAWIEEALSHQINHLSDAWIYANLTKSLIFSLDKKYGKIIETLLPLEDKFLKLGNYFLLGSFCTNLSLAYKNLGHPRESLEYLELARSYHQKSGHRIYLGTVENNLSHFYKVEGRFNEAHRAADSAVRIFRKLKDRAREGFTLDTKAQIYCAEGKHCMALETIDKAILILSKGENAAFIVETYLTKAKIFHYLENFTSAFLCLSDAVQLAKTKISAEKAENLVREFEELFRDNRPQFVNRTFSEKASSRPEKIELILHPTIAHYQDFQGVWIKNSHLEPYGLEKDSLAVVTKTDLKRGDLVAINEISSDSVMCGFYDSDFGLVCLEGVGEEPRFFADTEIEILGKIVGVGKAAKNSQGKIEVKPLNL